MQKRVLAVNDISCMGRCSLTVALPIISAAGLECAILPTSVLSTHTGGFKNFTFLDFTEEMQKICAHWKTLDHPFDAIYTGFLGSKEQIDVVSKIVDDFKTPDNFVVVDPAMADNGVMYSIFDTSFALEMKRLCRKADIICPNVTEACFLTGIPYQKAPYKEEYINSLIDKLSELGIKSLVLTGVAFEEDKLGSVTYDYTTKEKTYFSTQLIPDYFHGTGDCFASALVSALAKGKSLKESNEIAVSFTVQSILKTMNYPGIDKKYGVCFEEALPKLIGDING